MISNESFFNSISEFYDKMTGFEKVLSGRRDAYKKFIPKGANITADLGCGTGLDSIALTLNGLNVTAFDISKGMLDKASEKARILNLQIDFQNYSLADIPSGYNNRFSFAVSMGNTLANLDMAEIKRAVNNIYSILIPGGKLLLQILNYEKVIKKKERIVKITEEEEKYYVRFYDFHADTLDFNILSFDKKELKNKQLVTTKLYPYTYNELTELLSAQGFSEIKYFGNLNMGLFDREKSQDLIISADR
jgi:glycine/sarcosine N-methyltransferase